MNEGDQCLGLTLPTGDPQADGHGRLARLLLGGHPLAQRFRQMPAVTGRQGDGHQKFLAAPATDQLPVRRPFPEQRPQAGDGGIPGAVTMLVIDLLEVIYVDDDEGEGPGPRPDALYPFQQGVAVGEPGQLIEGGQPIEAP